MVTKEMLYSLLFPYDSARSIQDNLIEEVDKCIKLRKNLIVHAPTGLGKTAATLPAALAHATRNGLAVFFLTSRHTQHLIALQTLQEIKKKYGRDMVAVDIIGKQHMCPVSGVEGLYSSEFFEFCKSMREDMKCEFYVNSRKRSGAATTEAKKAVEDLKRMSPCPCEDVVKYCAENKLCPYEISALLAKDASVIISDYFYIFNKDIRENFFGRSDKELEKCILIIDEGHNLPSRARELLTKSLSMFILSSAIKEASKFGYMDAAEKLRQIKDIFENYAQGFENRALTENPFQQRNNFFVNNQEKILSKSDFIDAIKKIGDYDELIAAFEFAGEEILEKQQKSYMIAVAHFLAAWLGPDEAFTRILSCKQAKSKENITLSYQCLDPSLLTRDVIFRSYCTIIMSGTLTPTAMYKDILGFNQAEEREYRSPFPSENKLSLIVPGVTTKFTERNPEQYRKIAITVANIVNTVPGNSAVFFPSYQLRDDVNLYLSGICKKTTFIEVPGMSKTEKQELLEKFKSYKEIGAALLAVSAANYAEGIDLPGELLKAAVVVGLPLQKPDLETKELIDYYEKKYKKGWDYAYVIPAITKTLQSAGRCIRSETDRGIIALLDDRYSWPRYAKCFSPDWNIIKTNLYEQKIKEFFSR